jgi:hypothetical protein
VLSRTLPPGGAWLALPRLVVLLALPRLVVLLAEPLAKVRSPARWARVEPFEKPDHWRMPWA